MKVKIDVETKTFVRLVLVIIGFAVLILAIYKARTALITVGIAFLLALALNPPVSKLAKYLPGKSRVGATAISYLLVVLLIGGLLFLIVPPVVEQSSKFAQTVPGLIDNVTSHRSVFDHFVQQYNLQDQVNSAVDNAKDQASSIAANLGNLLVSGAGTVLNSLVTGVFILVLAFLMLIEGPRWMKRFWDLFEDQNKLDRYKGLVDRMYHVVTGFINGQVLVASIAASCTLIVILIMSTFLHNFFVLPANLAFPLAAIIFMTGIIPMVGATIGAILVSLILLLNAPVAALIFIIYFIVYQQIENNFIAPTIQSKTVELSALGILVAILIGVSLFGLLGGIIAIPIAGCIRVLVIDTLKHNRKLRAESVIKNPVARLIAKAKQVTEKE